jgi:hypothetical protein
MCGGESHREPPYGRLLPASRERLFDFTAAPVKSVAPHLRRAHDFQTRPHRPLRTHDPLQARYHSQSSSRRRGLITSDQDGSRLMTPSEYDSSQLGQAGLGSNTAQNRRSYAAQPEGGQKEGIDVPYLLDGAQGVQPLAERSRPRAHRSWRPIPDAEAQARRSGATALRGARGHADSRAEREKPRHHRHGPLWGPSGGGDPKHQARQLRG